MKPENIGFTAEKQLKLFDFGLAACVRRRNSLLSNGINDSYVMTGCTGTVAYMAPEVALRKPYNEKVDVYSFGIILWQMITGETPFEDISPDEYLQFVAAGGCRPSRYPIIARRAPEGILGLLESCWHDDPVQRPDCRSILKTLSLADSDRIESNSKASCQRRLLQVGCCDPAASS